jgi:hypothetical protein
VVIRFTNSRTVAAGLEPTGGTSRCGRAELVEARGKPTAAENQAGDQHDRGRDDRQPDVGGVGEQEAAEEQLLDVRPGMEDVARQDHAGCEAPDEDERGQAVITGRTAARQAPDDGREQRGDTERPQRGGEAETLG